MRVSKQRDVKVQTVANVVEVVPFQTGDENLDEFSQLTMLAFEHLELDAV
jgi:hypothetical protein